MATTERIKATYLCSTNAIFSFKCLVVICVMLLITTGILLQSGTVTSSANNSVGHWKRLETPQHVELNKCTFQGLRRVSSRIHAFPTGGKWINQNSAKNNFQPNYCYFEYSRQMVNKIHQFILGGNIRRIVTIGDSNALRYFKALKQSVKLPCKMVKQERLKEGGFLPDRKYYTRTNTTWQQYLKVDYRFCSGCAASQWRCPLPHKSTKKVHMLTLEHLPMTRIIGDALRLQISDRRDLNKAKIFALTSQEFFFRYYMKDQYPDIFLIFLPITHEKLQKLDRMQVDMSYFYDCVKYYLPPETKLVFFPYHSEFDAKRKSKAAAQWINRTFEGMLATDWLRKANQMLYDTIEEDWLSEDGRVYAFLDSHNASLSQEHWSLDGVHMKEVWYDSVISMMWQLVYESFETL